MKIAQEMQLKIFEQMEKIFFKQNVFKVNKNVIEESEQIFNFLKLRGQERVINRILVVRTDEIGDVLLTSPFLRELRKIFPNAFITLVVKNACYNLVEFCPYVNKILCFDWLPILLEKGENEVIREVIKFGGNLWSGYYDLAVVPRFDVDLPFSSLIAYFSGARWRLGFSETVSYWKKKKNEGYDFLFTEVLKNFQNAHEVNLPLQLLEYLGAKIHDRKMELWLKKDDEIWAENTLQGYKGENVILALGSIDHRKCWPIERFIEIAEWLYKEYQARIILTGTKGEKEASEKFINLCQREKRKVSVLDCTGKTTIRQLAALLKKSKAYLGRNTGVMHLAVAAGINVIEISSHPQDGDLMHMEGPFRFGAQGEKSITLQPEKCMGKCKGGCYSLNAHCILQVSVNEVKNAIKKLW